MAAMTSLLKSRLGNQSSRLITQNLTSTRALCGRKSQLGTSSPAVLRAANRDLWATSKRLLSLSLAWLVLLAGCAVGPNYKRPEVAVPSDFRGEEGAAQQASFADLPWWEAFKDQRLQQLIQTALTNNYDLRIAITRVEQARQLARQAKAQFFPMMKQARGTGLGQLQPA